MKANLLTMAAFMIICGSIMAKDVIPLEELIENNGKGKPNITNNPEVSYEDGTIELRCDSTIENATVSIKDEYDNTIYMTMGNIGSTPQQINIPEDVDYEKVSIEIITDNKAFKGEFLIEK